MKKGYRAIALIIILAYIIRILPYLLGYPVPITDDSLRDFSQVNYIIENGQINFSNPYGSFPLLHLIVFGVSSIGFNPLQVFLFLPQLLPAIGLLFFFLFLRRYFPVKESIIACFLIAVFPPHIHWSSQPVRETIGLFFFPLIIYLFDRTITSKINKANIWKMILLFLSFVLLIISHHWSTVMCLIFLFSLTIFVHRDKTKKALTLIAALSLLTITYWSFAFRAFLIRLFETHLLFILLATIPFIAMIIIIRNIDISKLKNSYFKALSLIALIITPFIAYKFSSFSYPLQIWIGLLVFLALFLIGFFLNKSKNTNNFFKITLIYALIFLAPIFLLLKGTSLVDFPFDSLRVVEFAIFSASIIASYGFLKIKEKVKIKYLGLVFAAILIILSTFIYPSIFIYGNNFENTPFYDIRSDIRYIPPEGFELIEYANNNNYTVKSNYNVIKEYQSIFFKESQKQALLITKSDLKISEKYPDYIKNDQLGLNNPEKLINKTKGLKPIYTNDFGKLYDL
ncbi:hypothetical protein ACFLZZ_03260 [Nanoarchaeota archaeon]